MKSLGVLNNEMDLMDHIIQFCKVNELEFDVFDSKKIFLKNSFDVK